MKPYQFNKEFLEPLLSKIKAEGKGTFLAEDFNPLMPGDNKKVTHT